MVYYKEKAFHSFPHKPFNLYENGSVNFNEYLLEKMSAILTRFAPTTFLIKFHFMD